MANSDWLRDSKLDKPLTADEAFIKYCTWFAMGLPETYGEYWFISDIQEVGESRSLLVTLAFWNPWTSKPSHKAYVRSLEELAWELQRNRCPIPQSLASILGEYRQGRDGSAAVNFYTQSGSPF